LASPVSRQKAASAWPAAGNAALTCPEGACTENDSTNALSHGTSVSKNAASPSTKDTQALLSTERSAPLGVSAQLNPGAPGAQVYNDTPLASSASPAAPCESGKGTSLLA
jgi:hypothetical protein